MNKGVQESGDSKERNVGSLESEPSATMEAESTLQSLVSSIGDRNFSVEELPGLMRMYLLSLRLLGIDDEWASKELNGYTNREEVPKYRLQYRNVKYITVKSDEVIEETNEEICKYDESIVFMVNHREKGWGSVFDKPVKKRFGGESVATKRRETTMSWNIHVVLDRIAGELFDRASKTLVTARFGQL
jgi:hypothetical protein